MLDGNYDSKAAILDILLDYDNMLEGLAPNEERLIRLVYLDGMTFEDAAKRLKCPGSRPLGCVTRRRMPCMTKGAK